MIGVRNASADHMATSAGLASWYVPGRADGFGDRLLMFDNTSTPSLELLRFHRQLTATLGFEDLLQERVRRLRNFRHAAFAPVRAVQYLDDGQSLALVSEHAAGQRLSEIFEQQPRKGLDPGIVTWLLRELVPALASLQAQGPEISHGALTPDRIILTPEGRLCVVEHVLGSALDRLERSPSTLFREFSVIADADEHGASRLDAGADVAQLAGVALSMLMARPLTLQDVQFRLPLLLDELSDLAAAPSSAPFSPLRQWLERALHVGGATGYRSAADAQYDVRQLPTHTDTAATVAVAKPQLPAPARAASPPHRVGEQVSPSRPALRSVPRTEEPRLPEPAGDGAFDSFPSERATPSTAVVPEPAPRAAGMAPVPTPKANVAPEPALPADIVEPTERTSAPVSGRLAADPVVPASPAPIRRAVSVPVAADRSKPWLVGLMAVAILAQSAVIAFLATRATPSAPADVVIESARAGDTVLVNGQSAGMTPLQLKVGSDIKSLRIISSTPAGLPLKGTIEPDAPRGKRQDAVKGTTDVGAAAPPRRATLRLTSPIELKVLENDDVLGSTGAAITLAPGVHQLDLENVALGYRSRQTVNVKAGQSLSLGVSLPDGLLSVNAEPWAVVEIDGKSYGETPLANLKVPIGEHVVVFRHPQLGEQRKPVTVRATDVARLSVKFER